MLDRYPTPMNKLIDVGRCTCSVGNHPNIPWGTDLILARGLALLENSAREIRQGHRFPVKTVCVCKIVQRQSLSLPGRRSGDSTYHPSISNATSRNLGVQIIWDGFSWETFEVTNSEDILWAHTISERQVDQVLISLPVDAFSFGFYWCWKSSPSMPVNAFIFRVVS